MTEIFAIIIQLFFFIFFSFFPFNKFTTPKIYHSLESSQLNCFAINIVFLFCIFLITSFTNINLTLLFNIFLFLYIFLFYFNFRNIYHQVISKNNFSLKLFFLIINFFFFVNTSSNLQLGWDALSIWIIKVNNFYTGNNYFNLFSEEVAHKNYPHLGSYIWAFFWKNSLIQTEYFGRLFYDYIFLLSIFILIGSFKKISNFYKLTIAFIIITFTIHHNREYNGYQEYLIFSLLVFCGKLFLIINSRRKIEHINFVFIFLILSTILIPWIKNEGMFYSLFIGLIFTFTNQPINKKIIFLMSIIVSIFIQFLIIKYLFSLNNIFQFSLDIEMLLKNLEFRGFFVRLFSISLYLFYSSTKYLLVLFNIIVLIYILKKKILLKNFKFFLIFFLLNLLFIYSIYIFSPFDLTWHLQTSIKRLVFQTSGFYFLLFTELFNERLIKSNKIKKFI
jgi:hypothetical protein